MAPPPTSTHVVESAVIAAPLAKVNDAPKHNGSLAFPFLGRLSTTYRILSTTCLPCILESATRWITHTVTICLHLITIGLAPPQAPGLLQVHLHLGEQLRWFVNLFPFFSASYIQRTDDHILTTHLGHLLLIDLDHCLDENTSPETQGTSISTSSSNDVSSV